MEYLRSKLWKRTDKSAKIFAIGLNALKFTENYGFHVASFTEVCVFHWKCHGCKVVIIRLVPTLSACCKILPKIGIENTRYEAHSCV